MRFVVDSNLRYYFFSLFCLLFLNTWGQIDTTLLRLDILDPDKSVVSNGQLKTDIVSGFRIPVEPNDLPFTVFIISQDEIILNGYTTIVDAIAGLPGIRVSQPGSGEDGETFMMNGLYGNSYTKILINNVPVKPYILSAFPIGAQLPIRNVERIEVFYGSAASLHGSDASAGVINIVTKENTKPNFVQANYTIGEGAYQNINVMYQTDLNILGKKLGFSLYGNATQADKWQVDYDELQYWSYEVDDLYRSAPNFVGGTNKAIVNSFPHASRLFGLEVKYRKLKYESQLMYRREHSSLGLNPTAVSYDESLSFIGERINNMRLSYKDQWGPIQVFSSANILDYNMDKNSSIPYLAPIRLYLDARSFEYIESGGIVRNDTIRTSLLNNQFSDGIFHHASSTEINVEHGFQYKSKQGHYLNVVGKYEAGQGGPSIITPNEFLSPSSPFLLDFDEFSYSNFSAFIQAYTNFNKIKILFDTNLGNFTKTNFTREELDYTYRIAASYLINKKLKFRTSVSSAFKAATPNQIIDYFFIDLNSDLPDFIPETSTYFNLGMNWHLSEGALLDISYYSYAIKNHLIYTTYEDRDNDLTQGIFRYSYGFAPEAATFKDINGIQVFFRSQQFIKDIGFNVDISLDYSWGKERYDRVLDFEGFGEGDSGEISGVRGAPKVMAKLNLNSKLSRDFYFRLQTNYYGPGVPFSMLNYLRRNKELETRSGIILNTAIRYQINRYFAIHGQIFNLFNVESGGIDANGTLDVLDYNPQRQRSFRLGLDYIIR